MFYKGKTVLVTGGAGFVGLHIIKELLKQDAKVRTTIHHRPLPVKVGNIEKISADLTKEADCLAAVKGVDYVFHAAGAVSAAGVTVNNPMFAITENLILTARMLQAAWAGGVSRFLVFSSSTAYPVADYPVKEEEMWNGPPHSAYLGYGWMRRYLEKLSEFVASKSNMKIAVLRPTAVYGQWDNFDPQTSHVIPALIRKAVDKKDPYEVWGSGEEIRDFLHVTDLARACLLMLEKYATCDPINIGYGKTITVKEIVRIILKAAGHHSARVVFDKSKPTTIPIRMVDTSKSKRLLGFEPKVSLEDGLTDTVLWYRERRS
ncbi:MAG: NAD-dependent epimerase/dehydratase family protein [Candidatus Omnitrophica bacterium]|nr:NAD-dependent epimerase/dehydratase family protein [Candidatus Omnitrophota bacterium]